MEERPRPGEEEREADFHPFVYALMAAVVLWLVLVAWIVFAVDVYAVVMLVVISFTALGFLAVPCVFWLLSGERGEPVRKPLRDWAAHIFETWGDRMLARDAAVNAVIAPAAAAITLTLAGIVAWWVLRGSP